jgi:CHASE1-domain containing sensor protein
MTISYRHLPAGLVALLGLILSVASFFIAEDLATRRLEAMFQRAATDRLIAVERRIDAKFETVRSVVSFFEGS